MVNNFSPSLLYDCPQKVFSFVYVLFRYLFKSKVLIQLGNYCNSVMRNLILLFVSCFIEQMLQFLDDV